MTSEPVFPKRNSSCIPVAIKDNTFEASPNFQQQFEREARMLAQLSHANLPRVTNHFVIPGRGQYFVMDLVIGQNLSDIMSQRGALPIEEVMPWIKQLSEALNYLHSQFPPIIHRDIKPDNIIITSEGKVMLVDFGIAKVHNQYQPTLQGARGLTPGYSPPEQYRSGETDARSDVYALGATYRASTTYQTATPNIHNRSGGVTQTKSRFCDSTCRRYLGKSFL